MGVFQNVVGTPLTPQFAEFVIKGSVVLSNTLSKAIANVYHFRQRGALLLDNATDLADKIYAVIANDLNAALSVDYVPNECTCRFMDDPTSAPVSIPNTITGAITGDRMPSYGSVCMRVKTAGRGQNFRGSKHFGPIGESDTLLDKLTAGAQGRWDTVAAVHSTLTGVVTTAGGIWDFVVLSQNLSDFSVSPSIFTGATMTECTANSIVGTMRRRREKA